MAFEFDDADILPLDYYDRDAHELAALLLGKVLVRHNDDERYAGRIVELEVYGGVDDLACHADKGVMTERTRSMFGEPGTAYVYTSYGIHKCLNIVAAPRPDKVAAILVRALEPIVGLDAMASRRGVSVDHPRRLLSGPGKLTQAMAIDRSLDGTLLIESTLCVVAHGDDHIEVETSARVGLNPETCGAATDYPWRYTIAGSQWTSC